MHTYADDRGRSVMSLLDHLSELPGQFNASWMYAGVVKAWHRHQLQDDHWIVLAGALKVGLFNADGVSRQAELRRAGPRPGADSVEVIEVPPNSGRAVYLGEHATGVLRIPAGLWHGGVAVGGQPALLLYYVTRRYDPKNPDEERAAWDAFDFAWNPVQR